MAKINEYLTIGEAAEFLGVSKDTRPRWDRAGKFEAHRRLNRRTRISADRALPSWRLAGSYWQSKGLTAYSPAPIGT